jgi:hypothetical protein
MNWMEFVLQLTGQLVWPTTLIICLYLLRSPLSLLIPFAESIKYKDFELQFSQELEQVSQQASDAIPAFNYEIQSLEQDRISDFLPNASILTAWAKLDQAAKETLLNFDSSIHIPKDQPYKYVGQALLENQLINQKQSKLFHELRSLRNKVAHAKNYRISSVLAKQYIEVCSALTEALKAS